MLPINIVVSDQYTHCTLVMQCSKSPLRHRARGGHLRNLAGPAWVITRNKSICDALVSAVMTLVEGRVLHLLRLVTSRAFTLTLRSCKRYCIVLFIDLRSGVPKGRFGEVQTPLRNSEGTRLWKLLKIAECRTPAPQDVSKKGSKILKLPRFAIVVH